MSAMADRHFPALDTNPVKVWRVEPEKLAIQVGDTDKRIAKLGKLSGDKQEV